MTNDKCSGFSLIEVLVAISLMALIAVYLGAKTAEMATEDKFYKTCYMMEEIKEAIIGREGLYCNGVRQFTGYVSDMGNLPNLYYFDNHEKEFVQVTRAESGKIEATEGEGGASLLAEALKKHEHIPQPIALWRKTEAMPEWKYHEEAQLWAGWRGPYIDHPSGGALRDAWGNKFLFVIGEAIGHEGKTYRCKKTYKSTRDKLRRPGDPDAADCWEVIYEDGKMNFRTWQNLGTAIVKDTDGNELEDYDIPESLQTKQEKFYAAGCLTVISLGADNEPGGEGLDKDIQIVIDPTEYVGEVAGNVGNQQELFADKVCLYYPNYTEEGGNIEELCIPESGKMENNSQLLSFQPDTGLCYTGIDFRFGEGKSFSMKCLKWECDGTDGTDNCKCSEHEEGECIRWKCINDEMVSTPGYCVCTKCYDLGWGGGIPPNCWFGCEIAICNKKPDNWDCNTKDRDCVGSEDWEEAACCMEREEGPCVKWECKDPLSDEVCECIERGEPKEDPNTNTGQNIPIGIRTVTADSTYYTISVCPGGNWIGTVRGD